MSSRVAIITGAGQGIGRAISLRLARDGLSIVVNDIPTKSDLLEETVAAIRDQGGKALAVAGDASVEADVENLVKVAVENFGALDVFVANAGIALRRSLLDTTMEQFENLVNVNERGVFLGYKAAARQMIKQGRGGRIIGACSVGGKQARPQLGVYCATKFFVRGLTQVAAAEWGSYGITVNAYAPGTIDTPLVQDMVADTTANGGLTREEWLKKTIESTPVKSLGYPDDIAGLVSYLASENSKFITGQAININGGVFCD